MTYANNPVTRQGLYWLLEKYDKRDLFPRKYYNIESAAESNLINWLLYPTELDTLPSKIELLKVESINDNDTIFNYWIFKFKTEEPHWAAKRWMVAWSRGSIYK